MTGASIAIRPSTRVLGLGNDILSDDALGIRVARAARVLFGGEVDVIHSSQAGFQGMDDLLGVSRLLVVDCILTGTAPPGTVYVLDEHSIPPEHVALSHSLSIFEVLAVARALGLPVPTECVILAVEAADCTTVGGRMHPDVEAAIPGVMERIARFL